MNKLNYIKQISKTLTNSFYRQPRALPHKTFSMAELRGEVDFAFTRFRDKNTQTYEWIERDFDWELPNKKNLPSSLNSWEKIDKKIEVPQHIAQIQERQYQSKIIQMAQASNSWFSFKK